MDIRLRIKYCDKQISLEEAIKNGFISIHGNSLEAVDNTKISISSRLFDRNNIEIFEHDVVRDKEGCLYEVIYDFGVFYLNKKDKTQEPIPLYILKLKNKIDVEVC